MILLLVLLGLSESYGSENVTGYDPSELLSQIFNSDTEPRGGYGLINQNYDPGDINPLVFDGYPHPGFGDGQGIKKKRRRRPKKTMQYIGGYINNGESFYSRPVPRPSLAAQALSSVTEALTSIAKYDDYQCVPRLLCEASGGMGGLPSVPGLESLLTLLSAYTGLTTNPLFVFGRAVYLGVSSRGNPASCRYAYPQCPTDAEKLVHYLNNHNGGFFRFFNTPQQQQNLEQFYQNYQPPPPNQNPYHQNAGQYGLYKPNLYESQQQYGSAYNYNRYKTGTIQKRIQNKPNSNSVDEDDPKWTFPDGNADFDNGFYAEEDVNNFKFPESNKFDRKTRGFAFPTNFVENPTNDEPNSDKFLFFNHNQAYYDDKRKYQEYNKYVSEQNHKEVANNNNYNYYNKLPANSQNQVFDDKRVYQDYNKYVREQNHEDVANNYNSYYNKLPANIQNQDVYDDKRKYQEYNKYVREQNHEDVADNYNSYYNKLAANNYNNYNNNNNNHEENVQTVYVVRGNGDPNRPEIIKLKPGQSISDF